MKERGHTDADLRSLFKRIADADDKQAFTVFFNAYHARLIQYALLFTNNFEQAEDVVSEVLIRLLKKRKELADVENIQGYLFFAVKNESLNTLKKNKSRLQVSIQNNEYDYLASEYTDPAQKLIDDELRELVTETVERLPPKRRMVYKLVKDEGFSYKKAAALLEISERTVEVHLKLAVKELRETVTRYLKQKKDRGDSPFLSLVRSLLFF